MSTGGATFAAAVEQHAVSLPSLLARQSGVLDAVAIAMMAQPTPADTSALYYLPALDIWSLYQLETRVRASSAAGAVATGCAHEATQASPVYTDLFGAWLAAAYRVPLSRLEVTASAGAVGGAL